MQNARSRKLSMRMLKIERMGVSPDVLLEYPRRLPPARSHARQYVSMGEQLSAAPVAQGLKPTCQRSLHSRGRGACCPPASAVSLP